METMGGRVCACMYVDVFMSLPVTAMSRAGIVAFLGILTFNVYAV